MRAKEQTLDPGALIEELKAYIGFDDADSGRLVAFAPHILRKRWELSQGFYDFILRNDSVRAVIEGSGHDLTSLRRTWEQWAEQLFGGDYGPEYAASRLRIGAIHLHIGVEERYTVAAFHIVRTFLIDLVSEMHGDEPELARALAASVHRVLDLDLSLICHAYDRELHADTVARESAERRSVEELLGSLLGAPALLILAIDDRGRIVHFNRGCEVTLGFPAAEVNGRPYVESLVAPAHRLRARADVERLLREPMRPNGAHHFPAHHLLVRGGAERVITWFPTIVPVPGQGPAKEYLWIGHDVTEEHRLQEQILHQEKMAALGLLAAGVAHEIGNPLASISSVAQTIRRKSEDEYVRGKLDLVRTHIERIAVIVRRMVDFARPPRQEWRACHVNDLVRSASQILEYDKRAKRVAIDLDLAEELPSTVAMEDQLTQVFLNVIINALDAVDSNPPERAPRIEISTRFEAGKQGSMIVFICRDNGPGIDESEHRRIFEPFYTTKEVGRGTGLGLSVSFRIIEEHGGRIDVLSHAGEGASFEVRIPWKPPEVTS